MHRINDGMKPFLIADTHFGHGAVIAYNDRPFADARAMDEAMVERWNATVPPDGLVYHLGDFAMTTSPATIESYRKRLNGRIVLIKGNHDHHKMLRKARHLFEDIRDYLELNYDGRLVVLCHYPLLTWRNQSHGSVHLHGHSHGHQWEDGKRRLNVGVECQDYRPIPLAEAVARACEWHNRGEEG